MRMLPRHSDQLKTMLHAQPALSPGSFILACCTFWERFLCTCTRSEVGVCERAQGHVALRAGPVQEFRNARGEDEATEGLSDADRDAVDITKLLSALQTGLVPGPSQLIWPRVAIIGPL